MNVKINIKNKLQESETKLNRLDLKNRKLRIQQNRRKWNFN